MACRSLEISVSFVRQSRRKVYIIKSLIISESYLAFANAVRLAVDGCENDYSNESSPLLPLKQTIAEVMRQSLSNKELLLATLNKMCQFFVFTVLYVCCTDGFSLNSS